MLYRISNVDTNPTTLTVNVSELSLKPPPLKESSSNLGLILGLTFGILAFMGIGAFLYFKYKKN